MARVLVAWELGGHFGHLGRLIPIAEALRRSGHEVLFCVCDCKNAAVALTPRHFRFVQAPLMPRGKHVSLPPACYAEVLLAEGYADPGALAGVVSAWLRLFELYSPDVIIADHAPSALISAICARIPVLPTGNGFEIPPNVAPTPSIRFWERIDATRLAASESRVLSVINACFKQARNAHRLQRLADLFHNQPTLLAAFPELDHYQARGRAEYAGPLFSAVNTAPCPWPDSARRRVFAYLHNGLPGLRNLLEALDALDADVVCVVTGLSNAGCARYTTKNLTIRNHPVDLDSAITAASLMVTQGGNSGIRFLLSGVPTLLVPGTVEQAMQARRVEQLGAGVCVSAPRTADVLRDALDTLLNQSGYADKARAFSRKYADFRTDAVVEKAVNLVERMLVSASIH